MNIAIGSDHAGFEMKSNLLTFLNELKLTVTDFGTFDNSSCDYPDYAHKVAYAVNENKYNFGILFCGSGQGVNMVANKYNNIRAALVWNKEIASLCRLHNNANILCIPARFIPENLAKEIINIFLNTKFEGGRHLNRINKIPIN